MSTNDVLVLDTPSNSSRDGSVVAENFDETFGLDPAVLKEDPPVIVGMACHLPGDIRSSSGLWDFLVKKKSAQGGVPPERYNIDGFYDKVSRSGTTNVPGGYFIKDDVRNFDNGFFGINNLEATYMDPQQRKLLEIVYETFQNSGTTMESVAGSHTGVFVANFSVDYQPTQTRDPDYLHRYVATGSGATIMSNRISHVFNLHGPSNTIDTACSSSVYALHAALNSLKAGDCESVIVASSNLILSPELHVAAAKSGVLSPTGTCHTFDASADGYGRAEGVNAVYIKRLSKALQDGSPIRAIIRGSAVGASGRTPGIALPSGEQQEVVMRKAYKAAGLTFDGTDYVECHGTGTPVGDPIEVKAVGKIFSPAGSPRPGVPLLIGSVKTNVGHSEGASGLTSILKVVESFDNGLIAPSQGVVKLNPKLSFLAEQNIKIATEVEQWPRELRRASINSFGYGGANAHVILEAPESYLGKNWKSKVIAAKSGTAKDEQKLMVLPVSASSDKSLDALVKQVVSAVTGIKDDAELKNLAFTLVKGRDALRHRTFVLATKDGVVEETAGKRQINPLPLGFVFTGQGAQFAGMAKELLFASQHFRDTIRSLDSVLQALPEGHRPDWTLEQTLLDNAATSRINEVTRSQPICTAVQVGLVELLRSWGVTAKAVVGHSSGEIAAAYTAGHLTASQAILVAYFRGFAVGELKSKGNMMAAGLTPAAANELIEAQGLVGKVRVACVNSPESVTISGTIEGIEALRAHLTAENKFARKLETGGRAYHSHMMSEIGELYESLMAPFFADGTVSNFGPDAPKMYSSVGMTDENLGTVDASTYMPAYWRSNLEQPVQFAGAVKNLVQGEGKQIHLVELGPHAALKGPLKQIRTGLKLSETAMPYSSSLVRNQDADVCLKTLAGELFTYGSAKIDFEAVNGLPDAATLKTVALPPYPWDYSAPMLWSEPRASTEMRNRKYPRHELLGSLALTGNGIDHTWRNILRLSEVPWVKDHKVENSIVFPAVGYLAMAIEGVTQMTGANLKDEAERQKLAYEFRNVNISAALNIPEEERDTYNSDKDLELHTTISPRKISNANASSDWHDFSVSSWLNGATTLHCAGTIRITTPVRGQGEEVNGVNVTNTKSFDVWPEAAMAKWYKKWDSEGLCFGPHFRSLTGLQTDSRQARREMIGVTRIAPPVVEEKHATQYYPVHPITIDAALQAAILSTTAGHVSALKCWLPVYIEEARIQPAAAGTPIDATADVHAKSEETGLSSRRIDGTLRDARGDVVVSFTGGKISLYTGKAAPTSAAEGEEGATAGLTQAELFAQRQPTLRINWKPDVLRLRATPEGEAQLQEYVNKFVEEQNDDLRDDESMAVIAALLDLAGHKNPRVRVLEVDSDAQGYKAKLWQSILDKETAFARFKSWSAADLTEAGELSIKEDAAGPFDVVLVHRHAISKKIWDQAASKVAELVSDSGLIISRKSDAAVAELKAAGFDVLSVGKQVIMAVKSLPTTPLAGRPALIITKTDASETVKSLGEKLAADLKEKAGVTNAAVITVDQLDNTTLTPSTICVSLLETETEFLATISDEDAKRLRIMTDNATDLLWITSGNMLGAKPDPNVTLSNGLSRALMLEQPTLRYTVLDLGPLAETNAASAGEKALKSLVAAYDKDDTEFIDKDGLLHISRYAPDYGVNGQFRRRLRLNGERTVLTKLSDVPPARLAIARPGALDTLHFQQLPANDTSLPGSAAIPAGFVDIKVKAVGLNAKDVYAINGRVDTKNQTTAFDFSGIVTAVGEGVTHLKVGDRAVACAPHHLGNAVRVRAGAALKLQDSEKFGEVDPLLLVYATALYAIDDRARLRKGESILVHAGSGGLGIAAITLAQRIGATVYTTAGSQAKRDYLTKELGVPAENIFNSRDASFVPAVLKATGGRGVDVVLNSLVGDLMHESWRVLNEFGRFVEVGKRELLDAGRLDMRVFLRNATFTAFDLSELFNSEDVFHQQTWDNLVKQTVDLYREGAIKALPATVFDASQLPQAYRFFTNKDRVGKIVISFEDENTKVPVAPAQYLSTFTDDKVYLLIGCLGGLGRSLSRWMMKLGARNFVFVGRSGADRKSARELVDRLEEAGANVTVVRGDVSSQKDIEAAVAACVATGKKIGGVVQAAMGLHEALFTRMPNSAWHTGIDPKWQGTWNLHNAIQPLIDADPSNELDFFLLTSSVSGTVGTATESNYCSANGFLDSFAKWRRSRGQPCISIGLGMISEVGYLHENPEIEALLLRKGIQPLNEEEFLQVVDLALASEKKHAFEEAHLLTGLEPEAIRELTKQGFDVTTHGVLVEARASLLLASLQAEIEMNEAGSSSGSSGSAVANAAPWFKEVPATLSAAFAPEADADTMKDAILRLIKKRFSNLILMPADQIAETRALPEFGVDSMIASEFRSWFWSVFKVDIPFLDIMSKQTSLAVLADSVETKLAV